MNSVTLTEITSKVTGGYCTYTFDSFVVLFNVHTYITMFSSRTTRLNIFLIGDIDTKISGNKLPSKKQVLKVLFFKLRKLKLTLLESATLVIKEVILFWEKARLPTQQSHRAVQKLTDLYKKWRKLQKNAGKFFNKEKEEAFSRGLDNLFDIAHGDVMNMVDEKGKEFLLNQRKDGRVGYIGDIETIYKTDEELQLSKEEITPQRLRKSEMEKNLASKFLFLLKLFFIYYWTKHLIPT